jgi:hypothetical protein
VKKLEAKVQEHPIKGLANLTVKDRLLIPQLFPERSNLITQVLARDIGEKIQFDQPEMKKINLRAEPNGVMRWDDKNVTVKVVTFTEAELKFLADQIARVDQEGGFTAEMAVVAQKIKSIT